MKIRLYLFLSLIVFLGAACGNGNAGDNKSAVEIVATETIVMDENGFTPNTLKIKVNTKVIFKNLDTRDRWPASNLHPTHGVYPEFDPQGNIKPQEEWSFVFDKAGSWKFHDHIYPAMRGVIEVVN